MKKFTMILAVMFLSSFFVQPVSMTTAAEPISSGSVTVAAETAETQSVKSGRLYGIGSVSKVFTAAAVMKLVDDGKLSLDETLTTYIPEFEMADERYVDITPRMLLNHSSGLMGMTDNNAFLMGDNDTYNHDHFLGFLKTQTLKHNPGEVSIYCNDGYTLAEILVERVSGISFTEFIGQNFSEKLGLKDIKTPQSDFDRESLAAVYSGSRELKPENLGVIGSGGIYASMEALCGFSTIFMDSADGSVISRKSADEMARNHHQKQMAGTNADIGYGLGWDSVNTYPFNQYGIKALSKGGATGVYHTNLTVLPEYNLAVAVSSSGTDSYEQLIAQEIILEILREEGIIKDIELVMPEQNTSRAQIPDSIKEYAGFYDGGQGYFIRAEFTADTLILTPIGVRNERPQEYLYNTDGKFVSTDGDYISMGALVSAQDGTRGTTTLEFTENKYIIMQTYESVPGLSQSAFAWPMAEKVDANPVSDTVTQAWKDLSSTEYLLVSEKYSSARYMESALAKIQVDDRTPGYVGMGIYQGAGKRIKNAKIIDENMAIAYQSTPTMAGRDGNILKFEIEKGVKTLLINHYRYIDAAVIAKTSEVEGNITITSGTVWFHVDEMTSGQRWQVEVPENGSWFAYDNKMNCVATSLDKNSSNVITLPENGRIAFAGEAGAVFEVVR